MPERKVMQRDSIPTFAPDYINHSPVEFSLTTLENEAGEKQFAFTFIDHVVVPEVTIGDDGLQKHGARLERRYKSTVVIEQALWDQMTALVSTLQQQSS